MLSEYMYIFFVIFPQSWNQSAGVILNQWNHLKSNLTGACDLIYQASVAGNWRLSCDSKSFTLWINYNIEPIFRPPLVPEVSYRTRFISFLFFKFNARTMKARTIALSFAHKQGCEESVHASESQEDKNYSQTASIYKLNVHNSLNCQFSSWVWQKN